MLIDILEGEVGKKRKRGKPILEYFSQIIHSETHCSALKLKRQFQMSTNVD